MRLSFEFFPPQTEQGVEHLERACQGLAAARPDYFSITGSTGGQSARQTFDWVGRVRDLTDVEVRPHLTCTRSDQLRDLLRQYLDIGVRGLVLLRGDAEREDGDLGSAEDLVRLVRSELGDRVEIAVAAYPEVHPKAADSEADFASFRAKVEAGADLAITQLFYHPEAYSAFQERCAAAGLDIDIVAGVMPISYARRLLNMCDRSGVDIPRWMRERIEAFGDDDDALRAWGIDVVGRLCDDLIARGAPGFHFYAMNRAEPSLQLSARVPR